LVPLREGAAKAVVAASGLRRTPRGWEQILGRDPRLTPKSSSLWMTIARRANLKTKYACAAPAMSSPRKKWTWGLTAQRAGRCGTQGPVALHQEAALLQARRFPACRDLGREWDL